MYHLMRICYMQSKQLGNDIRIIVTAGMQGDKRGYQGMRGFDGTS